MTAATPWRAGATTYRTTLNVDRGLSWESAFAYRDANLAELREAGEDPDPRIGFYVDRHIKDHGKTGVPPSGGQH
jgi:hypothetical protein